MNSYERVMAAVEHRKPDRPPLNYFGTPETTRRLLEHLRLENLEQLRCHFGADMRYVAGRYVGPALTQTEAGPRGRLDMWGVGWRSVPNEFATYDEVIFNPLAQARTLRDLREYPWPSPDWMSFDNLKADIAAFNRQERRAICYATGSFLELAWYMRGFEQFLMDMVEQPDMAEYMLTQVTRFCRETTTRAIECADGGIDFVWSSSDVGMQTGMICSPDLWRRQIQPFHRELVEPFKKMGLKTRYHTDGAVAPIIEDLIAMGVDLLDPIQPKTPGMEADELRARFGGRIAFYGGVDTQDLMPHGTPQAVEQEVLRLIRTLGSNGGYVVAASNAVQPDVPIENVLALYRTAREYRY